MKKLFVTAAMAIVFASTVMAQIQPLPPPKAVDDYFPERWQTYEFKDDKCRVSLPNKPKESLASPLPAGIVRINDIKYNGVVSYVLSDTEFSVDTEKIGQSEAVLESYAQGLLDGMKSIEPRVIKEQKFTFEGHPGKFLVLETKKNIFRIKFLVIKTRIYALSVTSGKTEPNVMGSENDYEKIAMTFLDSFQPIP